MKTMTSLLLVGLICFSAGVINSLTTPDALACTLPAENNTKNPPKN